jgi:hypothetical protein
VAASISPVLAAAVALARARRAECPTCHGRPLAAERNVTKDGASPPDLAARDWGVVEPCACGARPMTTVYIYGPPKPDGPHRGWRPLLSSSLDMGSVSQAELQAAILTVFCREPEPGVLPPSAELSDAELSADWQPWPEDDPNDLAP